MTEHDWLRSRDPRPMLDFLNDKASDRKLRLYCVACCRRSWRLLQPHERQAVEAAENYSGGMTNVDEFRAVGEHWTDWELPEDFFNTGGTPYIHLAGTLFQVPLTSNRVAALLDHLSLRIKQDPHRLESWYWPLTARAHADLLRDVFGPLPFRQIAVDAVWRTSTVARLLAAVDEGRRLPAGTYDNYRLGALADALEDAGCDQADLLQHLRSRTDHVLGCWALDLLREHE